MASQLQISETISRRTVETEVIRNVGIPSRLPPAERVVSVNARLEITDSSVGSGRVVFSGIIRSSIFYAPIDEDSNVVTIRRNFNFTEQVSVSGARPGYDANIDAIISDIDFYVINERLLGVEYIITSDIEVTAPESIDLIEEREDIQLRREQIRIRREIREREFTREFSSIERLDRGEPDLRRVVNIDSDLQIIDTSTEENRVIVNGVIRNDLLYLTPQGNLEYTVLDIPLSENFNIRGIKPDMTPFVEANIIKSEANRVDSRRVRIDITITFNILVITEQLVSVPTGIISPEQIFPVRRSIIVERVVAEERTRILARGTSQIPEGSPDINRVIRATGRLQGPVNAVAERGGVAIDGLVATNIIYVADLPNQPVYFTSAQIPLSYFFDIENVSSGMNVVVEANVLNTRAEKVNSRQVRVRSTVEVSIIVTERVRVAVVTGVSETPVTEEPPAGEAGFITYTVQSGDTLFLIAQRYGVNINTLIQVNNLSDPNNLRVGQQILIPRD